MKKLVIIGASGHGKVVADIAVANGYEDIVFLDDDPGITECAGFPVVGKCSKRDVCEQADCIVAIGNARIREKMQKNLNGVITLIHPQAVIGRNVIIGEGSVIMAGTVINHGAKIGKGCIINTGSSVDHDCVLEDYVHVSIGSHVAGTVTVEKGTWIGAGAIVNNNLHICAGCTIGAGAVVVKNIEIPGTYMGIPARIKN